VPESIISAPNFRYTDKDYATARPALIADAQNRFPTVNTDFSQPSYITLIINWVAILIDFISFYLHANVRELVFPTVTQREMALQHTKLIGYEPPGKVAATTTLTATLTLASSFPTPIPAGSSFPSGDGTSAATFQSLDDATIPAGIAGTSVSFVVENSVNFSETFVGDGSIYQEFTTATTDILLSGVDGSGDSVQVLFIEVEATPFTVVENFLDSEPTSAHVRISLNNLGRLILRFGNGTQGIAPLGQITVTGRRGGGARGNEKTVTRGPALRNTNNDAVSVAYANSVLSSGGADELSIEEIKVQAPQSLQVARRTVSHSDFVTNVESVPGVDRALVLTSNEDPSVDENTSEIVVISDSPTNAQITGGNAAATLTTDAVDDEFTISINGETPQTVDLGNRSSGEDIAAEIQARVRAMVPEYPLDNDEAYSNFTCEFDPANVRYLLTTGQASLSARIVIGAGSPDASVVLKIDTAQQSAVVLGADPAAGTFAAITTLLTVTKPVPNGHQIALFGPLVEIVNVHVPVRFSSEATTTLLKQAVRNGIRTRLQAFFSPINTGDLAGKAEGTRNDEIEFATTVRVSDLLVAASGIHGVDGIESINEDAFIPADDVPVAARTWPVLGGIRVIDVATSTVV